MMVVGCGNDDEVGLCMCGCCVGCVDYDIGLICMYGVWLVGVDDL